MNIFIDFSVDIQENDNEIRRDNELKRKKKIFFTIITNLVCSEHKIYIF